MENTFGVNVWWTVPGLRVSGDTARTALSAHGFEERDMPNPSRRAQVSRAAYHFQNRRGKSDRRITEIAGENSNTVIYGILGQEAKGEEEVGFEQNTTIRLTKDSGRVEVEGDLKDDYLEQLAALKGAVTDQDVRTFLRRVIRMCYGVAKRPSGGIYFVPDRFKGIVESAKQVLAAMGTGARLYVERVTNGQQERQQVWESVELSIESSIDDTLEAVERIEKRASSVQSQEGKIGQLNELVEVYKQVLGEEAKYEEITEKLSEAEKAIGAKLAKLQGQVVAPSTNGTPRKMGSSKRLNAAEKVIREAGKALDFRQIAELVKSKGYYIGRAKNPAISMNSALVQDLKAGNSRFVRVGSGLYGLATSTELA
jgi:hypothetical protein